MFKGHGGNLAGIEERFGIPPEEMLDFSSNVNPVPLPELARQAFYQSFSQIGAYPDPRCRSLVQKASLRFGHPPEEILAGNGSTEFIFLIPRIFPQKRIHLIGPTYPDYEEAGILAGKEVLFHDLGPSPGPDDLRNLLDRLPKERALLFFCNPNNPTGTSLSGESLRRLVYSYPFLLFIIDEAYADFSGRENVSLLGQPLPENLLVLRSLTKIFGIPGIRLGLVFGTGKLIARLDEGREPWTVNLPAQKAGEVLLGEKGYLDASRLHNQYERVRLGRMLRSINGLEPFPSDANFILVKMAKGWTADALREDLIRDKILIRSCQGTRGLGASFFRLAVKGMEEHLRLLEALSKRFS